MKYWYLKGADVVGPLSVEEISADAEFSGESFVCPEPNSADAESWKSADQYLQDFGYLIAPETHLRNTVQEEISLPDNLETFSTVKAAESAAEDYAAELAKSHPEPVDIEELTEKTESLFEPKPIIMQEEKTLPPVVTNRQAFAGKEAKPSYDDLEEHDALEETIHVRSPLNAGMDDNLLDEIPASAVLSAAEEEALEVPSEDVQGVEAEMVFNEAQSLVNEPAPEPVFEEDTKQKTTPVLAQPEGEPLKIKLEDTNTDLNKPESNFRKAFKPIASASVAPKREEEPTESLDTFTTSSAVLHIDPASEHEVKTDEPGLKVEPVRAVEPKLEEPKKVEKKEAPKEYSREEAMLSVDDEKAYCSASSPNHGILSNVHQADSGLLSVQDSVNNQFVKSAPTTTGKIISSTDGRGAPAKSKRNDLIYLMVIFMFVFVLVASMMMFTSEKNKEENVNKVQGAHAQRSNTLPSAKGSEDPVLRSVIQGVDEGVASPDVPMDAVKNTGLTQSNGLASDNTKDLAIYSEQLVRIHMLASGETIEQHFDKLYSGGYQTRWGSNILHGSTYVVEFFASKVRSEPIRYMFSVNVSSGKIGGMNNSAVDLVGK